MLSKDRWTHVTEKKNVGGRFPSLKKCKDGFGDCTFVVKGDPKDKDLRDRVKAHEKQHGDDDEAVFNDLLGTWDKEVTKAFNDKIKSKAPNINICQSALHMFGGKDHSPDTLVTNMAQGIKTKGDNFHNTAAGSKPNTNIEDVVDDCRVVKARTG